MITGVGGHVGGIQQERNMAWIEANREARRADQLMDVLVNQRSGRCGSQRSKGEVDMSPYKASRSALARMQSVWALAGSDLI